MKKNLNFLIKPSSSLCNMTCKYCFYHSIAESRQKEEFGHLKEDIADALIEKAIKYSDGGNINFGFQGGEPTLSGLAFFEYFVNKVNELNTVGCNITYAIQTNGILVDEKWCEFFVKNDFLVGISLDGTKEMHDLHRLDNKKSGTHSKVMKTISILDKYKVRYNILIVVTKMFVRYNEKAYNFFKKNNFEYLQYIPVLEPKGDDLNTNQYALDVNTYFEFLTKLFKMWKEDIQNGLFVNIRMFNNILNFILGNEYESCDMKGSCSIQNVVEFDGTIYPCDFYTHKGDEIGNILSDGFEEMYQTAKVIDFIKESLDVPTNCQSCEIYQLCNNGCKRYRAKTPNGEVVNYYCGAFKAFYMNSIKDFVEISKMLTRNQNK